MAPLYDAVSTLIYPGLSREFAMSIGDERDLSKINRDSFACQAMALGVSPNLVWSRIDALVKRMLPAACTLFYMLLVRL